jgi:hypothetical protein
MERGLRFLAHLAYVKTNFNNVLISRAQWVDRRLKLGEGEAPQHLPSNPQLRFPDLQPE